MKLQKKWIVWALVFTVIIILSVLYGCESQVLSLSGNGSKVNRAELNYELENYLRLAELRKVDLDRQDQLRTLILQNGLVLIQGQPFNPFGILTGLAAIYGVGSAGTSGARLIKKKVLNP